MNREAGKSLRTFGAAKLMDRTLLFSLKRRKQPCKCVALLGNPKATPSTSSFCWWPLRKVIRCVCKVQSQPLLKGKTNVESN